MNDRDYRFPNKATPLGSSAYYAVRFAPAGQRDALAALFALRLELDQLLAVSDVGVARLKLDWWRKELGRAIDGQSQHPLIEQLPAPLLDSHHLSDLLDAAELRVRRLPVEDERTFHFNCRQYGGSLAALLALAESRETTEQVQLAGSRIGAIEALRDLGQHLRYQYQPLPRSALPDPPQELLARPVEPVTRTLVQLAARLPEATPPKGCVGRLLRLREALLDELQQAHFDVLHQRISLTPLRKLWLGWRSHN